MIASPQNAEAATTSFKMTITKETTASYEKVHFTLPRQVSGNTYSHILGDKTNTTKYFFISKTQKSSKTEFVLTPLKEGSVNFALGLYQYNGSTTDMVLGGIIEFSLIIKKNSAGRLYVSNLSSSFVKNAYYTSRSYITERYDITGFKKMTLSKSSDSVTFTQSNTAESDANIKTLAKKYCIKSYYFPNGDHVHTYKSDGKCSRCGLQQWDYMTKGIQYTYYKIDPPEKGKLLTVNPKTSSGQTVGYSVQVYLPYGYKSTNKYDVIFLVPGSNGTIDNWMKDSMKMAIPNGETFGNITGKRLFDWLIYTGQSVPFIAVSIPMQPYNGGYEEAYLRYANFIKDYWLPMIIDGKGVYKENGKEVEVTFGGTYAKSSKEADIKSAKNHFMIVGLSQGSLFVAKRAVKPNSDLGKRFGIKVLMSPFTSASTLESYYNSTQGNCDKLYFVSGGELDTTQGGSPYEIVQSYKKNATLKKFQAFDFDSGHRWYTWFRGIATVLQTVMK